MAEDKEIKFAINKNKSLTEIIIKEDKINSKMNIKDLKDSGIKLYLDRGCLEITKNNGTYTFKIA